jgi:hypothetical protein
MTVLCKFRVSEKTEFEYWEKGSAYRIKMVGVKGEPFGSATPVANLEMVIVAKEAADEFVVGVEYQVRFISEKTPAEEPLKEQV